MPPPLPDRTAGQTIAATDDDRQGVATFSRDVRRARLRLSIALTGLLALMGIAAALIVSGQRQEESSLTSRFEARQATAARFIQAYVTDVFQRETALGSRAFSGAVTGEGFARTAAEHGFDAAVLLDSGGRLIASQPASPERVGSDLTVQYAHLRTASRGAPAVSGVVPSAARGVPIIAFAVPFETPQGRRVFSGAYAVEDTPLAPFVNNATPFRTGRVLVIDEARRVVASNQVGEAGQLASGSSPTLASVQRTSAYVGVGDQRQFVTQSVVTGTTWTLLFAVDTAELFRPLHTAGRWVPWLALIGSGLLGLLTLAVLYRYQLQRARLAESEGRRHAVLDTAGEAFVGMDDSGLVTDWNASAARLLGWSEAEALGRPLVDLIVPSEHRTAHSSAVARFLSTGETSLPRGGVRVQALRKDGTRVDVEFEPARLRWGPSWHFHAFLRDISEQLEHDVQLRRLALTDDLTGLSNRRSVLDRLEQALARAKRRTSPVAVLFIDVDDFKAVNDRYGHAAGDAVLAGVAARLRAIFRVEDSVARLGGDEFLVVCEDLHGRDEAQVLADRTRASLAQPYGVDAELITATCSVGLAVTSGDTSAESLLARADAQMYDAKAARQAFIAITRQQE